MSSVRWVGRERLKKRFRKLPELAKEEARKGLGNGADEIVAMMKRSAPKGRTGNLRRSIHWMWSKVRGKGGLIALRIRAWSPKVKYAHLVEFGTAPHKQGGRFKGTEHPGTRPQPFFFPSYRALKKRFLNLQRRGFRKAIAASKNV